MSKEKNGRGFKVLMTIFLIVVLALLLLRFCSPNDVHPTPIEPVDPPVVDPIVDPTPTEQTEYTVTFYGIDGSILQSQKYKKGEIPSYDKVVQSVVDGDYVYTFTTWDKEITPVTSDTSYKALSKKYYIGTPAQPAELTCLYLQNTSDVDRNIRLKKVLFTLTPPNTLEYSLDKGNTWTDLSFDSYISVPANTKIFIREKEDRSQSFSFSTGSGDTANGYFNFEIVNGTFNVGGDITSLLTKDGNVIDLTGHDFCFYYLFNNCTSLISARDLILPSATLASSCYRQMFYQCTSLTKAPALPAEELAYSCYRNMFSGCTSLTTAPTALPADELASGCYYGMFRNCSNLATAPALPATTLANICYQDMFWACSSLTTAPALPATTLTESCYWHMFDGCTSLETAPALPATTMKPHCYLMMFNGCTSLETAPALPATTLAEECYKQMFSGCTSLNSITVGFDENTSIPSNALNGWLPNKVEGSTFKWKGTDGASLNNVTYNVPNKWTVVHVD